MSLADLPEVLPANAAASDERLPVLDFLRGLAILAILPANIPMFGGLVNHWTQEMRPGSTLDRLVLAVAMFFIFGKFVTLLSILFGAGLALQADRVRGAGRPFARYYCWRMALLFGLGLFHAVFLWYGDILTAYAFVGLLALPISLLSQRGVLWFIGGCLLWSLGMLALTAVGLVATEGGSPFAAGAPLDPDGPLGQNPAVRRFLLHFSFDNLTALYRDGSVGWMLVDRGAWWLVYYLFGVLLGTGFYILGCFLVGIWLVRHGVFHNPQAHRSLLKRLVGWGLLAGLPFQVLGVGLCFKTESFGPVTLLYSLGALAFTLAYLGLALPWFQRYPTGPLQRALQATGRLALTNYLLQSVLCNLLFYSYGLRLYGELGYATCFALTMLIWMVEVVVSVVWLHFFQIGPVEWLWRSLADGQPRPLLRMAPVRTR